MQELQITSRSFEDNGFMPEKNTGFGQDISPDFQLLNMCADGQSVVIIMDDLDIRFMQSLNHWVLWNIPRMDEIPEGIPYGSPVPFLGNAIQGKAYGNHRYRFEFFVLDCFLSLDMNAVKKDVVAAMQGHVMQHGSITGKYKR